MAAEVCCGLDVFHRDGFKRSSSCHGAKIMSITQLRKESLLHHMPLGRLPGLIMKLSNALSSNSQQWVHCDQKERNECLITKEVPPPWTSPLEQGRPSDSR